MPVATKGLILLKAGQLLEDTPAPGIDTDLQEEMESVAADILTEFWFQPAMSDIKGDMEVESSTKTPTFCFCEGASSKQHHTNLNDYCDY